LNVRRTVDAQLPPQIVAATIYLLNVIVGRVLNKNEGELFPSRSVNDPLALKLLGNGHGCEDGVPGILLKGVLVTVGELLLVVVAPSEEPPFISDGKVVTVSTHDLSHLLGKCDGDRFSVALLEKGGCRVAALRRLPALTEGVVAHSKDLPIFCQSNEVVRTSRYHLDVGQVFDENWRVGKQSGLDLHRPFFYVVKHVVYLGQFLLDLEDVDLALFS
jgi:hypothetical protein